jgi:hypothetical protein
MPVVCTDCSEGFGVGYEGPLDGWHEHMLRVHAQYVY